MGIFEWLAIVFVVALLGGTAASVKDSTDAEAEVCFICASVKTKDHPAVPAVPEPPYPVVQ